MKKWCRTFLLSCLLCLSLCTLAQATDGETLRVGLKYGSDAMSAANLQNYSAFGGYALGYFDADGSFEELGALPQLCEKITVTTDTTYHVQLSGTFYDYDDASRTAAQYSGGFAAYEDGAFYARAGSYTSLSAARSAAAQYGGTAVGGSSTGVTVIVTGTDTILFEFDCGGSENLGILPIETREKTVTWFRGYRYYGGASEDSLNVWGNDVGYLKGKIDPYEGKIASVIPRYNWSTTFTASELTSLLNNRGYGIGTVKNAYVSAYTDTGNVYSVTFTGTSGSKTVSREACRSLLNLRSQRFTIGGGGSENAYSVNDTGESVALSAASAVDSSGKSGTSQLEQRTTTSGSGSFVISGSGYGHNVGMSQWGAYSMANLGYSYRDILQFYYTDVSIR